MTFKNLMGAYHYQALTSTGQKRKGIIEADSERQARQFLREKDLIPTQIQSLSNTNAYTQKKHHISIASLALLTRQLATLLAAGLPVAESLSSVSEQTDKPNVRKLLINVRMKILEGYGLAQAMRDLGAFPELYTATVASGEQTGRLDLILEKLADYLESMQKTKQKVQQALIYPSLMILISGIIISFLLAFVVPKIIEVFTNSGQTLPKMTVILITISDFLQSYGLYLVIGFILIGILFQQGLKNIKIKTFLHHMILKIPVLSRLIISNNIARYIHTFAILFTSGVSVLETMRVSASLITNIVIQQAFNEATIRVREGSTIQLALKETHFLSPMAIHLIANGEKSGQLANMMEHAAVHLDNEVKRFIDTALTLLEPMIILFMGVVVLFIVLATLLPIFSMEQLVI